MREWIYLAQEQDQGQVPGYSKEHEMCRISWAAKEVLVYGKVSYMYKWPPVD